MDMDMLVCFKKSGSLNPLNMFHFRKLMGLGTLDTETHPEGHQLASHNFLGAKKPSCLQLGTSLPFSQRVAVTGPSDRVFYMCFTLGIHDRLAIYDSIGPDLNLLVS